jgi:hypothetical protein
MKHWRKFDYGLGKSYYWWIINIIYIHHYRLDSRMPVPYLQLLLVTVVVLWMVVEDNGGIMNRKFVTN